jgi:hypothetical protein
MKKSFVILLFFIALGANAQGNLQFNQVINLTAGSNYTVPVGKVLKIESISMSSGTICIPRTSTGQGWCYNGGGGATLNFTYGIYDPVDFMQIGDIIFKSNGFNAGSGIVGNQCAGDRNPACWTISVSDISPTIKTPLWLKEGKSIFIYQGTIPLIISAIEFNVVQ